MNTPDKQKQEELQHKLDQLYIYTGRSKDSPRIKPRDFDKHAKAIINSEVLSALEKVKDKIIHETKTMTVTGFKEIPDGFYNKSKDVLVSIEVIEKEYKS